MASRPLANPVTYGTVVGTEPMSSLDTSFGAVFTSGFNDSALGWVNYGTDIGVVNAYAVTLASAPSTYVAGMTVTINPVNTNTGASTINVNALGAKNITTSSGSALTGNEIVSGLRTMLVYDGTNFFITSLVKHVNVTVFNGATDCSNATIITGRLSINAAGTTTLNNVADGAIIDLTYTNNSGSNFTQKIAANKPGGGAYVVSAINGAFIGGETDLTVGGFLLNSGNTAYFKGVAQLTVGQFNLGFF